jgi:nucleoside-diphosphate-sugar epimerase
MRLLLTGATGFLGNALARLWSAAGHRVWVPVRPSAAPRRALLQSPNLIPLTVAKDADWADAVAAAQPEVVVHTACAYGRAGESSFQVFDTNLRLGMVLLQALLSHTSGRVTVLNSATVLAPEVSLYALSKRQFSEWGSRLARAQPERLRFVDLRLQHLYGAGDDPSKFTTRVLHVCHRNEELLDLTAGEQRRDFIHVDDAVLAFDAVLRGAESFAAADGIDVGSGQAPTVRQFVETVHRLTHSTTRLNFGALPYRPDEAMLCVADTARLRALGWPPARDLAAGLTDTFRQEFHT